MKKVSDNTLFDVAELFKIFADSTRIRILYSLYHKEKKVNDIAQELSMNQSAISHQLKILKDNHLIKCRRQGKEKYYSLDDNHVYNIINQGLQHIKE